MRRLRDLNTLYYVRKSILFSQKWAVLQRLAYLSLHSPISDKHSPSNVKLKPWFRRGLRAGEKGFADIRKRLSFGQISVVGGVERGNYERIIRYFPHNSIRWHLFVVGPAPAKISGSYRVANTSRL